MVATWTLTPGQEYRVRINSSTAAASTQGFAWRQIRVLAEPDAYDRLTILDMSDPAGVKEKRPYLANVIEVEGQVPPPPSSPAGGLAGVRLGDVATVDPLSADVGIGVITRVEANHVRIKPVIGGPVRRILKNRLRSR